MEQRASDPAPHLTFSLKVLMQGKEVGSIIGKKGDNVKRYREESGAKINISDGSCLERVVTVTGSAMQVRLAFDMICHKLEEDSQPIKCSSLSPPLACQPLPAVTIKLLVPGNQCGSLIGKGGAKIKEIREVTGASVQVASDMLRSSTERMVTISGSAEAVVNCIGHVCSVMTESPHKGAAVPYRPRPVALPPQILYATTAANGGQAYALPITPMSGGAGHILPEMSMNAMTLPQMSPLPGPTSFMLPHAFLPGLGIVGVSGQNRMNFTRGRHAGGYLARQMSSPGSTCALSSPASMQQMTIPNELIGCVIGRGGSKINEIRQLSGAQIKISNSEEGSSDRKVTITGLPDTISMATYMISSRLQSEV